MLPTPPVLALNHLLASAPWARERLVAFAGRTARISLSPLNLNLEITAEGYFADSKAEPEVSLSLPAAALFQAPKGLDALVKEAHISGPADFADTLGFVLRNLKWDAEEDISKLVGDVAAHRLTDLGKRFFGWQRQVATNTVENISEYLSEEQTFTLVRRDLDSFAEESLRLRADLERLESRVAKLG